MRGLESTSRTSGYTKMSWRNSWARATRALCAHDVELLGGRMAAEATCDSNRDQLELNHSNLSEEYLSLRNEGIAYSVIEHRTELHDLE